VQIAAPAKINLTLHVTGQRNDGYHLLDSLVCFANVGDTVSLQSDKVLSMTVEGPEAAAVPADMRNLVLKTAALFEDMPGASFVLTKTLPVSSGIGGGSADAAAAFRGLMCVRSGLMPGNDIPAELIDPARTSFADKLLKLGADIPVCLLSEPTRMRGVGEDLTRVPDLPPLHVVLVNPRVSVSTPAVFAALPTKDNPAMPAQIPQFTGPAHFVQWLSTQRNDLQATAQAMAPEIGTVLAALGDMPACQLARMSGSGATCFGIFADQAQARTAAKDLQDQHTDWWITPALLGDMSKHAIPRIS